MKVTMKRSDLLKSYDILSTLKGAYSPSFKYALKKNKDILKLEFDALEEAKKTNCPKFEEYEQKQTEKLKECIEYDENGNPVYVGTNRLKIRDEKVEEFKAAMMLMEEVYKDAFKERAEEVKKYEELLKSEIEIEIHGFINNEIPVEIDQDKYDIIFPFIQ